MWSDTIDESLQPRRPLQGPLAVAAGFTGLWTACCLEKADPSLSDQSGAGGRAAC